MGLFDFATKLFGNKYDKDLKEINPVIDQIKAAYPSIQALSNDELRQKTSEFKKQIQDAVATQRKTISDLKEKAENTDLALYEKESLYSEIDKIEKEIVTEIDSQLNNILTEAFCVVKETASRFSQGNIEVTANEFDRNLAAFYDNVVINGDKATYNNKWIAAGTEIATLANAYGSNCGKMCLKIIFESFCPIIDAASTYPLV